AKKRSAALSFKRAVTYNPQINITNNEVLDESIIPFFQQIKSTEAKPAPKPRKVAAAPTTVKILSNAKRANIYVGSKRIGQPGQRIKMRPGSVVVTLKAKGYQSKSFRLNLAKSVE